MDKYLITDIREYIDIYLHGCHYGKVCDYINEMMFMCFRNPWDDNIIMEDEFDYDKYSLSYDELYIYFILPVREYNELARSRIRYRGSINYRKLDMSYKYSWEDSEAKISNFKNRCMTEAHVPQNYGYTHFSKKSLLKAMGGIGDRRQKYAPKLNNYNQKNKLNE